MKTKENILPVAGMYGARLRVGAAILAFSGLLLGSQSAFSQVPEGGLGDDIELVVEDSIIEVVEERVQERIEDDRLSLGDSSIFEEKFEEKLEESIEQAAEEDVQEAVDDNVEIVLEGNIENAVEQNVEETIEGIVEESVEQQIENKVIESVAQNVEAAVEEDLAADVEQEVETGIESNVETVVEAGVEGSVEVQVAATVEDRVDEQIDEILDRIEIDESRIKKDQWLVMAAPEVFDELAEEGYLFDTVTDLPGLGLRLAEVAAPSSFDITNVRQGVIDIVGSDRAEVDFNHIYTAGYTDGYSAGDQFSEQSGEGIMPRTAIDFPGDTDQMPLRIGMIDSQVDTTHPALRAAHIQTRSFTSAGAVLPSFHGTAIASIIVGNEGGYVGIAPHSEVFAAGVFEQDPQRGEIASTVSLVKALDWLISSEVDVVNISLAGPPNKLLEAALQRAAERNVTILAAAGNGGPVAAPMYPAAYASVVAVTAVDANGKAFRLANRGDYLDIAAPGVGLRHAKSGGGYAASSGTSFAVPFAATAVARLRQLQPGDNALDLLCRSAEDLGPPGRDNIYGFGLLRPTSS